MSETTPERDVSDPPGVEDLGRAFASLVRSGSWEIDAQSSPGATVQAVTAPERNVPPPLIRIVEAILFVGGPPLTAIRAQETIHGLSPEQFLEGINDLNRAYRSQGRPYVIRAQDQGFVLCLRPRYTALVEKLYGANREARLSQAAIDVLALIAYRQPTTKQDLDGLRGSDCGSLLRQLVRRGLVAVIQRGDGVQRDVSYGTTDRFLEFFGLASLDDLPQTQDLQIL
jgi:segregation and condensation protein B